MWEISKCNTWNNLKRAGKKKNLESSELCILLEWQTTWEKSAVKSALKQRLKKERFEYMPIGNINRIMIWRRQKHSVDFYYQRSETNWETKQLILAGKCEELCIF